MLTGAVFQLLMGCLDREWIGFDPLHISLQSALAVLYMVIFGSIVAVNCYAFLIAHVPAQKVTTYALVNPVIALGLGALVLHEKVGPAAVLSAILVLAGVALILFQRRGCQRSRWRQPQGCASVACARPLEAAIKRPLRPHGKRERGTCN
jgi:drug/metabolite transporter (DMT)-like permease